MNIGGHDLQKELNGYLGKFILLKITTDESIS